MKKRITRALLYLQRITTVDEKPNPVSSVRIAEYLISKMPFDAVWHAHNPAPELPERIDELWFVASSWAYLDDAFRQRTLEIFPLARRVVWCNNDWNVPFHAYHLGRVRPDAHLAALSTVSTLAERFGTDRTLDWNRLTYAPLVIQTPMKDRLARLYYYGSLRVKRIRTFDRYFPVWGNFLTVSAANGKDRKRFADRYATIEVTGREPNVYATLDRYMVMPLLEDSFDAAATTRNVEKPPNRFYEALSAGTAMFFEPESVDIWRAYGYDVSRFLIPERPVEMLDRAAAVARAQRKWARDYRGELDADFDAALAAIRAREIGIVGPPPGAKRYL